MKALQNCRGVFLGPYTHTGIQQKLPELPFAFLLARCTHLFNGSASDWVYIFLLFAFAYSCRQRQNQQSNIAAGMLHSREQIGATG
jgi:hypothetical protein